MKKDARTHEVILTEDEFAKLISYRTEYTNESLEEEVDRWYNNEAPKEFEDVLYADIEKCAKHFARWQKAQMMKDAVNGYVIEDIEEGNGDFLLFADYIPASMGLKDQQKVKVIVLKYE